MARIAVVVPVYKNLTGALELLNSIDEPVIPIIIDNWRDNIGVSAGWNQGIKKAIEEECDLALVCNDDVILAPGTLWKLALGFLNNSVAMVTAVNARDGEPTETAEYPESPDFSCFMIQPRLFVTDFGQFDENFSPAYFEDNDMHYRIKLAGGKAVCRTDAGMFHLGSVTQNWNPFEPVVSSAMFEKNKGYYITKWGGTPGNEKFTEPFGGER